MIHDIVSPALSRRLLDVARRFVTPGQAELLVAPRLPEPGFWFGSGSLCEDADGTLLLCGRYRNGGDSRVGVEAGPRGAELAVFRSADGGATFGHVGSLLKADLCPPGETVLSIEGSCLVRDGAGLALYVSTEKVRGYPERHAEAQKPGTGVWSIDVVRAASAAELLGARPALLLRSDRPETLHVKDPQVFGLGDRTLMLYCTHPFSWTSSNTGLAELRPDGGVRVLTEALLPRGPVWDVAVSRVTARVALPAEGVLTGLPALSLWFYDGAECMHDHSGGGRPRGYSCEELGGVAVGCDEDPTQLLRLSVEGPLFVSPHASGCNRYVSVFDAGDGYIVIWQEACADGSQPLVINRVSRDDVLEILK
jgi:hypothetical protein